MSLSVIRYEHAGRPRWGVLFGNRIADLTAEFATTGELLQGGLPGLRALSRESATVPLDAVRLLSPITTNQQFVCQGVNYASHARESGLDPDRIPFNVLFSKASSSLCGARDDVVRPAHVRLLDYEVELGLVLARDISGPVEITPDALHDVLAGVTIVNDVSARDIQLPQGQFYKGKSYRTFGPVGPVLLLLDATEWRRWPELRLRLSVNGQERQNALAGEMLHPPHRTLTELSGLQDLRAGDLIATGTPAGCAVRAPGKLAMFVMRQLLSEGTKWRLFIRKGVANPRYLRPSDEMRAAIRTDDDALDLGEQVNRIAAA
jgi:2,4-diketo-3-deoxy-L-fuconate hydrolase